MDLLFSFGLVLLFLILVNIGVRIYQGWRRRGGAMLPGGDRQVRVADSVPVRIFVDKTIPSGPKAGGINRSKAILLLGERHLVLSTHHGRVLEIGPDRRGDARCVGPRRLVIEGSHPSGRSQLRAELIVDDAEGWAERIRALPATGGG